MKGSIIVAFTLLCSAMLVGMVKGDGVNADFTWTPTSPLSKQQVSFTDHSTPTTGVVKRIWYFGDGEGSVEKNPKHTYEKPGTYTVTLVVVWNISGNETADVATKNITVQNRMPIANAGPDQLVDTRTVTLNGSQSYDPDGTIVSYHWNFGDSTTGLGKVVQHTYASDGVYTVVLNVTDDSGGYGIDSCMVKVDTSSPNTTVHLNGSKGENGWFISNVRVNFTVNETLSGLNATFYRIDEGNWTLYKGDFNITEEGIHLLEFYSDDKAGNKENIRSTTIKIDKTSPQVDIVSPQEKKIYIFGRGILPTFKRTFIIGRITVEVNATDNIMMYQVKFFVNGELMANDSTSPYEWKWGGAIGAKTLKVVASDGAGHETSKEINVFIISFFKPRGTSVGIERANS